jgi:Tfp pilus assembly protein PilN
VPSINMIAARRMDKRRQEKTVRNLAYAIAGEIGVTFVIASVLAVRWTAMSAQVADLQGELHKIQPTVKQIQQMQQETASMQPKVAALDGAHSDTLFWYSGFYAVSRALPPQTWLTTLSTNGGASQATPGTVAATDPQISLSGVARSESQVGTIMEQMNQLPCLDHIDLLSVDQQKNKNVTSVSFSLTVHLKPEAASTGDAGQGGTGNA